MSQRWREIMEFLNNSENSEEINLWPNITENDRRDAAYFLSKIHRDAVFNAIRRGEIPPTGVRRDKSSSIHESGPKSQSDVICAKGTRFDKPIEIMEMRTHRDKRRDGRGKGERRGGGGPREHAADRRDANCRDWLYSRTTFDSHTCYPWECACILGSADTIDAACGYLQTATRGIILIVRNLRSRESAHPIMQNRRTPFR